MKFIRKNGSGKKTTKEKSGTEEGRISLIDLQTEYQYSKGNSKPQRPVWKGKIGERHREPGRTVWRNHPGPSPYRRCQKQERNPVALVRGKGEKNGMTSHEWLFADLSSHLGKQKN